MAVFHSFLRPSNIPFYIVHVHTHIVPHIYIHTLYTTYAYTTLYITYTYTTSS